MLFDHDLTGADMPPHTLCLTYDDGPGPATRELGQYLFEEGISAAFFVIGRLAAEQRALLGQLRDWGHVIGNHTWSHPGLVRLARDGGDVVDEIARTDDVIRPFTSGLLTLRPPYGSWRREHHDSPLDRSASVVAERLRRSGRFSDYVGPVHWDILAEDWECWRQGLSVGEAARRHVDAITQAGRGIVLLHDGADDDALRARNRTMQMTTHIVPTLKRQGYRFVPLDAVPCIAAGTN